MKFEEHFNPQLEDQLANIEDQVLSRGERLKNRMYKMRTRVSTRSRSAVEAGAHYAHAKPWRIMGVAVLAGMAVGALAREILCDGD